MLILTNLFITTVTHNSKFYQKRIFLVVLNSNGLALFSISWKRANNIGWLT